MIMNGGMSNRNIIGQIMERNNNGLEFNKYYPHFAPKGKFELIGDDYQDMNRTLIKES